MTNLRLSVAIGDYDRTRPLVDGTVPVEGVDPTYMRLSPEEIFFRSFRNGEFDICEMSASSYVVSLAKGTANYIAVPVFPSRAFRHTSFYVRKDRGIHSPADLRGRRIGVPEYQLTACVWARALLEDEYGVAPGEITWVRGGLEEPGRVEKIELNLPGNVQVEAAPADRSLSRMLEAGEIDAIISPRVPSCFAAGSSNIGWIFEDPIAEALAYFEKTRIFPIMHLVGIRRSVVEANPWLPTSVMKAFVKAKAHCLAHLSDTSATKVTLPFIEEQLQRARTAMGEDFWSYGYEANIHVLDAFLDAHYRQGLSPRRVEHAELFHPATLSTFRV